MKNKYLEFLKEKVAKIPFEPGIYLMKDENDMVIYVGKAKSLRKRVRQYFQKNNKSMRIEKMVSLIRDIDFIVVNNEAEALVLECNYIKQYSPKFNVMLKDDKTYPYIKIDIESKYPSIKVTRKRNSDKALYFGPYTDVYAMKETLNMLRTIFPVRRCNHNFEKNKKNTPCLYYHIGRCIGPCVGEVTLEEYKTMINQIVLFLQGHTNKVEEQLRIQIEEYIEKLEFEKAAMLKNRLDSIQKLKQKQNVANLNEISTDIWGYIVKDKNVYLQIFKIRNHKVVLNNNIKLNDISETEQNEILIQVITSYYLNNQDLPKKIYIKLNEENINLLNEYFNEKGQKIKVYEPKKGQKLNLIKTIENNIEINLQESKSNVLVDMSNMLGLPYDINSIECYDISNLRNSYIVGCMIRYEDGRLNKNMYRKFKIKSTYTQDDPKCMYEVLTRRLAHKDEWILPDVVLIDGSKTQLTMVKKAFDNAGIKMNIYGMVKNDKHRTRGLVDINGEEYNLSDKKNILNFLTYLQDEVHRFTITYHRKLRDSVK